MMRFVLFTLAAALLTLGACSDARKLPTAPHASLAKGTKTTSAVSTVCRSYRRKLRVMNAQFVHAPTKQLGGQIKALKGVVTDACN